MTELALIQNQIKRQQQLKGYAYLRWTLALEKAHASTEALGKALRRPQKEQ